jgi:hypothetical protein
MDKSCILNYSTGVCSKRRVGQFRGGKIFWRYFTDSVSKFYGQKLYTKLLYRRLFKEAGTGTRNVKQTGRHLDRVCGAGHLEAFNNAWVTISWLQVLVVKAAYNYNYNYYIHHYEPHQSTHSDAFLIFYVTEITWRWSHGEAETCRDVTKENTK